MWWNTRRKKFVFWRNGRAHLNRRGLQFSRLLAAEVCASAVVMLDTPCSKAVWRVLATHFIRQFPLHFPSRASPCAISFQLDSTRLQYLHCYSHSFMKILKVINKDSVRAKWRCCQYRWVSQAISFLKFVLGGKIGDSVHNVPSTK